MEMRVTVFERKLSGSIAWHTLGLGELDRVDSGPSPLKLQQRLIDGLRTAIGKLWPEQLEPLELVPGRRLERIKLELTLGEPKRRFRADVPLVLEERERGPVPDTERPLVIAYHPLRPDEWFPHADDRDLADEAAAYFRERWAALESWELERLRASGRESLRLVAFHATSRSLVDKLARAESAVPFAGIGGGQRKRGHLLLAELGVDQTRRASESMLEGGTPRSPWREQLQQLVCGARKSSVLLVGPPGCGKSTMVRRLVYDLLDADEFPTHRNLDRVHAVWQIRGTRIIAGMSYLGQWEQRCVDLLEACSGNRAVLWVDDLHAWGRIGESSEADRNLATFFRGPVARGELVVVGECTPEQYQLLQDDAPGFAGAFTVLWVEPTDAAQTLRLVLHESRELELRHGVAFDPRAFRTIAELGGALSADIREPGKSIELLQALAKGEFGFSHDLHKAEAELAAGHKIQAIRIYRELTGSGLRVAKDAVEEFQRSGRWPAQVEPGTQPTVQIRGTLDTDFDTLPRPRAIGSSAVVRLLARRTGVPELLLVPDARLDAAVVQDAFAGQVVGQGAAITAVTDVVMRMRSQLADATRPYGVLLLSGPTGTGKTELAKCLAEYLYGDARRLVRLDMGEYAGPDAPARLIGDRWRPDGALTTSVRTQPFCVVLLDEIDKADPAVLGLMLQVFDDGRLTDASGRVIDFTHAVVLLTSNLGARRGPSLGFGDTAIASRAEVDRAVREFFPPELFNRIDRVVPFEPLSQSTARRIATRELQRLLERVGLVERNVFVRFTPAVVELVVAQGFAQKDGARSLKRWLEDHVGAWLADEITGRAAAQLRVFWLHVHAGELRLHGEHLQEAEMRGEAGPMRELMAWDARRLRLAVPDALARVEAILDGPALARLGVTLEHAIAPSLHGDRGAAEVAHNLESLRGDLLELRDRLRIQAEYDPMLDDGARTELAGDLLEAERFPRVEKTHAEPNGWGRVEMLRAFDRRELSPDLPLRSRPQVLEQLGELRVLERALEHAEDPDAHTVIIELARVSRSRSEGRFGRTRPGLLEWLAMGYARGRGQLEQALAVDDDGSVRRLGGELEDALPQAVPLVLLRIGGPGVASFYAGEHGCHVRHALSGATEVVRVRVLPGRGRELAAHAAGLETQRAEFVAALERGDVELPINPDAVPPILRAYHFDPSATGAPTPIEVEDFPIAHVLRMHVVRLAEVLPTLWMLRLDVELAKEHAP